jgi:hypothetical protein
MADTGSGKGLSLIAESADVIGTILLVLMVIIMCWKAYTRQPVANADAFLGLLGLFAICIPILAEVSFEGLGLKLAAKLKQEQAKVNRDYDSDFAALKKKVHDLEQRVGTLSTTAVSQGWPAVVAAGAAGAGEKQGSGVAAADAQVYKVFIFFTEANGDNARQLENRLIGKGYEATSRFSSLTEVVERQPPGKIRVVRRPATPEAEINKVREALSVLPGMTDDRLVIRTEPLELRSGDIQIQMF